MVKCFLSVLGCLYYTFLHTDRGLDTKSQYAIFMSNLIHFFKVNFLATFNFDISSIPGAPLYTVHPDSPVSCWLYLLIILPLSPPPHINICT